jgi:hypothetical protein
MLRLKQLLVDTCHETVAFLARRYPLYCAQEFGALARMIARTSPPVRLDQVRAKIDGFIVVGTP